MATLSAVQAPRETDANPGPGCVLRGSYRIEGPLATGGMGEVFVATHTRLPGRYALKMPRPQLRADADTRARFDAEARVLATLRHPNIVQVIDYDILADGTPWLVMELVEGAHLRQHLAAGPLAPARVGRIVGQLAGALQLAHDHGVVHCDLKLENVMFTSASGREQPKLLDFGIARTLGTRGITGEDAMCGTPHFMAPEQVTGTGAELDDRADQFALACVVHTLLTGHEPFTADSPIAVLYKVVHEAPDPLEAHLGPAFACAGQVLRRALAKTPDGRFATITEFARTLQRALALAMSAADANA